LGAARVIGLDTNVLIRYLRQDDPTQSAVVNALFETALSTTQIGFISIVTIAEIVWLLRSRYRVKREEITWILDVLLSDDRLLLQCAHEVRLAQKQYEASSADFPDLLIAVLGRNAGCSTTVTFDAKASRQQGMSLLA
jgi:predicted nucleic-acid-binding protein